METIKHINYALEGSVIKQCLAEPQDHPSLFTLRQRDSVFMKLTTEISELMIFHHHEAGRLIKDLNFAVICTVEVCNNDLLLARERFL